MGVQAARLIRSTATGPARWWCLIVVAVVAPTWAYQAADPGSTDSPMVLLAPEFTYLTNEFDVTPGQPLAEAILQELETILNRLAQSRGQR